MSPGYQQLTITAVKEEVPGFRVIRFRADAPLPYRAGQYLTLVHGTGDAEIRRSYSLLSAPGLGEPLSIGVRRVDNGQLSRLLVDEARPGDTFLTTGAGGLFVLPDVLDAFTTVFLLAAGSGITPVYSILKTVLRRHPELNAVLVYSNARKESAAFLEELQALQKDFASRFRLELLFSNAPDLRRARLHRELLLELLDASLARPEEALFYICGPESYMRFCSYTLQAWGAEGAQIKRENFFIRPVPPQRPPDTEAHTVVLQLPGGPVEIRVQYPDTILRAARRAGLRLPYSCEAGQCGSCAALCTRGTVWHSYNEVLTERDLSAGLVLTCTGYPVGGTVELRFNGQYDNVQM